MFELQQFIKFKRSFRIAAILNTRLWFESEMDFIDVLIKLKAKKVAENLCKEGRNEIPQKKKKNLPVYKHSKHNALHKA